MGGLKAWTIPCQIRLFSFLNLLNAQTLVNSSLFPISQNQFKFLVSLKLFKLLNTQHNAHAQVALILGTLDCSRILTPDLGY
jgi:hypothetical protein